MNANNILMMGRQPYRGKSLFELNLTTRTKNALKRYNIKTIGDVLNFVANPYHLVNRRSPFLPRVVYYERRHRGILALLMIRNCGRKTVERIADEFIRAGVPPALLEGKYPR